jgi:hypothetical protein
MEDHFGVIGYGRLPRGGNMELKRKRSLLEEMAFIWRWVSLRCGTALGK